MKGPATRLTLLVRVDAGPEVGLGHAMRSLALCQAWLDQGGRVEVLLSAGAPAFVVERYAAEGARCSLVEEHAASVADVGLVHEHLRGEPAWLLVDGYAFDSRYRESLNIPGSTRAVWIDDIGGSAAAADLVVNVNPHASPSQYGPLPPGARTLLGTRYALIRREVAESASAPADVDTQGPPGRLLLAFGGTDPAGLTLRTIEALERRRPASLRAVRAVLGTEPEPAVAELAVRHSWFELIVGASDMGPHLRWADAALAAAGGTTWELMAFGVPCALVVVADNQAPICEEVGARGAAMPLGRASSLSADELLGAATQLLEDRSLREDLARQARRLVDGRGAVRVVRELLAPTIDLRRGNSSDCRRLFDWTNDPEVRRWSFSSGPVAWDEHRAWFTARLEDRDSLLLVAEVGGTACGMVRFEYTGDRSIISVSLGPEHRGTGLGASIISAAVRKAGEWKPGVSIDAFIKPENAASVRSFEKAGFALEPGGDQQLRMVRNVEKARAPEERVEEGTR